MGTGDGFVDFSSKKSCCRSFSVHGPITNIERSKELADYEIRLKKLVAAPVHCSENAGQVDRVKG